MRIRILGLLLGFLAATPLSAAITGTLMNSDGLPVAGAKVTIAAPETLDAHRERLLAKSDRTPIATTQSDAKGAFKFEPPKDATVELRVEAKGFAPFGLLVEHDGEVPAIMLRKADMKSGKVTANGKPVAGAIVVWSGSTEVLTTTDAEGRYSVPDPAKWAYHLTIVHPDFAVLEQRIMMMNDSMPKSLDRTLDAGSAISGRIVGSDGQTPIAKAAVSADGWPFAASADDGTFTIAHASRKTENVAARSGNLYAVRGAAGANTNLRLGKSSSLTGTLRDAKTRAPIAGAVVTLMRGSRFDLSQFATAITDAKGNYAFPSLTPGSYEIEAEHPSYPFNSITAAVTAGQAVNRSFSAPPLARISGVVIDDEKRPIAAATVSIAEDSTMFRGMRPPMRRRDGFWSGPDGRFLLLTSGEDEVALKARKKGLPSATSSAIKVAAGERKSGVVITIPRGLEVTGRVIDRDERPLSGVTVSAAESTGSSRMMFRRFMATMSGDDEDVVRSASDGTFAIRLTEGTYDLSFKREGFAMKDVRAHRVAPGVKPIEVVLEPGVEITGRVTRGGAPLEGVMVMMPMSGGSSNVTTGPDGSFRIGDLTPGTVTVNFVKFDDFVQEMRNLTAPARDVVIDLPRGGRVSGRVFDKATHQPVTAFQAGFSTSRSGGAMSLMMPPLLRSFRSDDGSFTLENVPTGPLQLVVNAPGYTTAKVSNLSLEDGKSLDGVEVAMEVGTRITGRVTDPSGNPLGGASVRIDMMGQRRGGMRMPGSDPEAMTDDSGEYTLEAVEGGEKTFVADHASFLSTNKTVDVTGREQRVDFQLAKGSRVSGQVITESGVPVGDAEVMANSASGGRDRAKTDASGTFTLENLSPGRYNFSATKQGYASAEMSDVDITSGAPIRLVMKSGGTIYGHVTGLTQSELSSTSIEAYGNSSNASAPVDSSGSFRIEGAPTGTVHVFASVMRNFGERKTSPSKTIQLEGGATQQVDLEFRSDVAITGRVTRNGRPQANATVSFNPRSSSSQTRASVPTNENGEYTITGLDDGTYGVTVMDMQRLSPYSTTYDVRGNGTFDIDVKVTTVRGRVIDAQTNEGIDAARIQLRPATQTEGGMFMTRPGSSDPSGAFTIDSVSPGRYVVTADKEKYGNDTREITVSETSADEVELKLARNPGMILRIVDARDNRPLIANVVVFDLQGRVVDDTFRFSMSGTAEPLQLSLAPGQYRASIDAMDYASRTVNITSPGELTVGLTPGGKLLIRSTRSGQMTGRLIDNATGQPYLFRRMRGPEFSLEAAPAVTNLSEIVAGTYTLQVLDKNSVVDTKQVTIVDGQTTTVDV